MNIEEKLKELKECMMAIADVLPVYAVGQPTLNRGQDIQPKNETNNQEDVGDVINNAN